MEQLRLVYKMRKYHVRDQNTKDMLIKSMQKAFMNKRESKLETKLIGS